MKLVVCICTHNREAPLERLLLALEGVDLGGDLAGVQVESVVVDNYAGGNAADLCRRYAERLPIPLRYVRESSRGISQARNRAVAEALGVGADWVAFIDDDDIPYPDWLRQLVRTQCATGADIVFGCWVLGPDVPSWVREAEIFKSLVEPADAERNGRYGLPWMASTCNVLIGREVLERVGAGGPLFDEDLSHSGGEDKDFFLRARDQGAQLASAGESVVIRQHDPKRFTVVGLFLRGFKNGCSRINKTWTHGGAWAVFKRLLSTLLKLTLVSVSLPFLIFSRRTFMPQVYRLGKVSGIFYSLLTGRNYRYYSGDQ